MFLKINKDSVGKIFNSNNCGSFEIIEYTNSRKILVEFTDTGSRKIVSAGNIRNWNVLDKFARTVGGLGYIGEGKPSTNGKILKEYWLWCSMIYRCTSETYAKSSPSYINCSVSDEFHSFDNFQKWCLRQVGFGEDDFALDKDILVKGNRVYSSKTCCFVPREINNAILKADKVRGKYPVGVHFDKYFQKYMAGIRVNQTKIILGKFNTPEEDFEAYKVAKENKLKDLAEKWKDKIDVRVYNALINYSVDIND